ncbi:MAG TPA: TonB-dependent receptor [Chitinophagaceae bacterium]|nr:TonB-dependent receptor [Chitinophagaceae bacterium]HPH30451.1 TonB-dependent receptor [Chitinophagaceae bacterium]HPN57534.1 TonB-dependent receptor [Chitinophagaceae bacterium]
MKIIILLVLFFLLFFSRKDIQAQTSSVITITLKVSGNCEMCKERIEAAAKGKGVKEVSWDAETKLLTLTYDTLLTRIEKVHIRIADAGHDTELKKAKNDTYKALPECCLYRDHSESMTTDSGNSLISLVRGVVLEEDDRGNFRPLPRASISWLGTGAGTLTDSTGVFKISVTQETDRLVISYTGYRPDTIAVQPATDLKIILASNQQLGEVTLNSKLRSTYISSLSTIRTQVMTEKELFKAACCNLSESFETNPSVDVSYNDAVTGSKQIQLLGLSGNYTQLTVENLPGPRGLATALGLNSIPGPWVESIQLNKGVGSVVNGYESIAGQINIELKKPEKAEQLYANVYLNNMGKSDINLNLSRKFGKKWSAALLLHDDFLYNKVDFNKDGFRDLPTGNLFSVLNRWKFENGKGFMAQFGVKLMTDEKTGGETDFDPAKDKLTTNHYGLGISTRRYEAFSKTGYVFPGKKYKSIGLQLMAFSHEQDSYFGTQPYLAAQQSLYANLIYQSIIGNTNHKFRTGLSWTADRYDETIRNITYKRTERVSGGFFEYTFTPNPKLGIVAGIRSDHNNLYGWFLTPRLHLRYEPVKGTSIRISAGRGQRTANIFAENNSVLVSARTIVMPALNTSAYGLNPEVAWNKGLSVDQQFRLFNRSASLSMDFFRNDFRNQVVVDLEKAREVSFYNLSGHSYSNSLQVELHTIPLRNLEWRLAYRYFDVHSTYSGVALQKPFTSKHRAFMNLAYEIKDWKLDYTLNLNGPKRIPSTRDNPGFYQRDNYSPSFWIMNAQVSKTVGKKHPVDLYLGGENLGNYFQRDVIISPDQPFGAYFDASLVWGPVSGRMIYAGLRYKIN